jgi:hypothetical protein
MLKNLLHNSGFILLFTLLIQCSENKEVIPGSPPIADPGTYPNFTLGNTISLDGSNSSDPDGDPLTYAWTIVSSPDNSTITTNNIGDRNKITAFFTPDVEGEYIVALTVNDGLHPPVTKEVIITLTPPIGGPPVANAGPNQSVNVNSTVTLDGSASTDPDDDPLTYNWAIASRPALSTASITNKDKEKASFIPDKTGNYEIELTITDITGNSDKDNVTITVK